MVIVFSGTGCHSRLPVDQYRVLPWLVLSGMLGLFKSWLMIYLKRLDMNEVVYSIALPDVFYGVRVINGIIVHAPPIAAWAIGKVISELIKWVELQGGITGRCL